MICNQSQQDRQDVSQEEYQDCVCRLAGAMKMVSNLKAIDEEGDKPVHVIQTDNAVTEVYGHGLTIIRATDSVKKVRVCWLLALP